MVGVWGFSCSDPKCRAVYSMECTDRDATILEILAVEGTCIHCSNDLKIMFAPPKDGIQFERFQAQEYWKQLYGLGSVDERVLGCTKVRRLLTGEKVVGVELGESQTGRCVIHNLTVESGNTFHFATGFGEAIIYKVTEEKS